ncbi:MAG: flagellar biosynthesis protein FliQ [Rhodospirillaceae bacterium]
MDENLILQVGRDAVTTMIIISTPILLIGTAIGLIIAVFQTLTQIQEMTLTYVPKILVVFFSILLLLPWMIRQMADFWTRMMDVMIGLP